MALTVQTTGITLFNLRTRMPFRYGIATLTSLPHLFLRMECEVDGQKQTGVAADSLPLAVESTSRRRGYPPRLLHIWLWLSGALVSLWLTALHNPLALLAGLVASGLAALAWHLRLLKMS